MQDFYGDNFRWFIGVVVDVIDPLKLDRVKVRIHGMHTPISNGQIDSKAITNDDLPWAQVAIPSTEPGVTGLGSNQQLKNRAQVFGVFLDGKNSQSPLILGSIPKVESLKNSVTEDEPTGSNLDLKLTGSTNIEKCFYFFTSIAGGNFTPEQACGIIGNFCVESGPTVNPRAVAPNEGSTGIAQWNPAAAAGNRLGQLVEYSNALGLDHLTLGAQLLFTKYELETFNYLGDGPLRKTSTVRDATIVFQDSYERPNKELAHTEKRVSFAKEIFNKLVNP